MSLDNTPILEKAFLLITLTTLLTISGAAQSVEFISPEEGEVSNTEFTFETSVDDFENDVDVTYTIDAATYTETSSNPDDDFSATWSNLDEEDTGEYNVTATAEDTVNDDSANAYKIVYVDNEKPSVSGVSIDNQDDGTIWVNFTAEKNTGEANLEEVVIERESQDNTGTWEEIELIGIGGSGEPIDYQDASGEWQSQYTYRVNITDELGNQLNEEELNPSSPVEVIDNIEPEIDFRNPSPSGLINDDEPTIEIGLIDEVSGVSSIDLELWDGDTRVDSISESGSDTASFTPDVLDEVEYTVNSSFEDNAGNIDDTEWTFEVDVTPPDTSTSLIPNPSDQPYLTTSTSITIELGDSSDVDSATCYVGDPDGTGESFGSDSSPSGDEISCGTLDPSDYSEGVQSIYVELEDEAGNSDSWKVDEYTFDTNPPTIDSISVTPEYTNEAPNITVEALDFGSGLGEVQYSFQTFSGGDGTTIDQIMSGTEDTATFEPDMSDKEEDTFDVYVRVQDQVGHWSSSESVEFTYDPDAEPEASFEYDTIEIEEGSETEFELTVTNEGMVPMTDAQVEFDGVVEGTSGEFELLGEESIDLFFDVETSEEYGEYTEDMALSSSTIDETEEVDITVTASEGTRDNLDQLLSTQEERLNQLEANLTELRDSGASDEIIGTAESDIEILRSSVNSARQAADSGNYHEAVSEFDQLETQGATATSSLEEAKDEYSSQIFRRNLIIGFTILVLLAAGIGAFFYMNEDHDLNFDRIIDSDIDMDSLEGVKSRIKSIFSSDDEAEEFEWNGFS